MFEQPVICYGLFAVLAEFIPQPSYLYLLTYPAAYWCHQRTSQYATHGDWFHQTAGDPHSDFPAAVDIRQTQG